VADPVPAKTHDLLRELVALTGKNADTLSRLLSVARFGPTAGAGGPGGGEKEKERKKPPTAAELEAKAFAERQSSLRERGAALQQIGLQGAAAGYFRATQTAEGLRSLGFDRGSRIAQKAAVPLAVAGAAGAAMDKVGDVARVAHDRWSTNEQKARALARMLPGGETLQKFHDSVTGRAQRMEDVDTRAAQERATATGYGQITSFAREYNPMRLGREAVADTYGRQLGPAGFGGLGAAAGTFRLVTDRSTAKAEVQFQNEMKFVPYRKELLRTERDLAKASAERMAREESVTKLAKTQFDLEHKRSRLQSDIEKGGSGPKYHAKLREHELVSRQLEMYGQQRIDAEQKAADARATESEAKGAHQKAKTALEFKGQSEVKQAAADRSMATARTLGEMDPIQRQQGLNILKMLQSGANPDLIPAEMKSLARAVAPQEYEKIITRHGSKTETFQRGKEMGLVGFEGDPFQLQKEADQLAAKGEKAEFKADAQAAGEVAKAGRELGVTITGQIRQLIEAARREIENQLRLGRSSSS
jgi:hypothetical protein